MNFEKIFFNKTIKAILMDVRGTLIHPSLDEPLSPLLAQIIHEIFAFNIVIALDTATSIQSLQKLIINPLLKESYAYRQNVTEKFIMYVDSSTKAYSLTQDGEPIPLSSFPFLVFTDSELKAVLHSIEVVSSQHKLNNPSHKIKPGQVNFYCGGSWIARTKIAEFINSTIHEKGYSRVFAVVPSSKETIDIAVCRKDRGVKDFKERFNLRPEETLIIGDSLQEGGPDLDMVLAAPGSLGIQVGKYVPPSNVYHNTIMPQTEAVQQVLKVLLSVVESGV